MAAAYGYLVVIGEPQYAWAVASQIPPELREKLVSTHGVAEQKIAEMRNRKTEIVPTYVGAFVPSEQLFADIEKRGRLADVNRLLGELQSKVPKLLHVTLSFIVSRISPKVQTE